MSNDLIRNISDTAAWVAVYRAMESERSDPVFRDPFARRLAGERGEAIMTNVKWAKKHAWSYTARTYLVDTFIEREIRAGVDMVINLAAGLDARPYRMNLPSTLQWVEIDFPDPLAYKEEILRSEKPACRLRRVPLDLSNAGERRALFEELGRGAKRVMITSEGLLIYLDAAQVCEMAKDLAAPASFQRWATDLVSPGLLKMLRRQIGTPLDQAGASLKFGPAEGLQFFEPCGWKAIEAASMLKTGALLHRLPFPLNVFALLPDTKPGSSRPWGGVCLLEKSPKIEGRT